jgi:hypothetical protein
MASATGPLVTWCSDEGKRLATTHRRQAVATQRTLYAHLAVFATVWLAINFA